MKIIKRIFKDFYIPRFKKKIIEVINKYDIYIRNKTAKYIFYNNIRLLNIFLSF